MIGILEEIKRELATVTEAEVHKLADNLKELGTGEVALGVMNVHARRLFALADRHTEKARLLGDAGDRGQARQLLAKAELISNTAWYQAQEEHGQWHHGTIAMRRGFVLAQVPDEEDEEQPLVHLVGPIPVRAEELRRLMGRARAAGFVDTVEARLSRVLHQPQRSKHGAN